MFFLTAFWLNIKRMLINKPFVAAMLLLPLAMAALGWAFRADVSPVVIRVGVLYDQSDEKLQAAVAKFRAHGELAVTPYALGEEEELARAVRGRRLEVGYVLGEGAAAFKNQSVTVLKAPGALADALLNELLTAALLDVSAVDITAQQIAKIFKIDAEAARTYAQSGVDGYRNTEGIFVAAQYDYVNGAADAAENDDAVPRRLAHGLLSAFLLMAALFAQPALAGRVAVRGMAHWRALAAALFCLLYAAGALGLCALGAVCPALLAALPVEAAALAAYVFALCGIALAITTRRGDLVYAAAVLALILTVTCGGAVLDLREIAPALGGAVRVWPTAAYLCVIFGDGGAAWALWATGLCGLGISAGARVLGGRAHTS